MVQLLCTIIMRVEYFYHKLYEVLSIMHVNYADQAVKCSYQYHILFQYITLYCIQQSECHPL